MIPIAGRIKTHSKTFLEDFTYKYLPYWPLFILLAFTFLIGSLLYLRIKKPVYEITATILLNDEKKGADEAQLTASLNVPESKKIVENEIEVLKGRKLMDEVVKQLHLYAPITEKTRLKQSSAYISSPVRISISEPDNIKEVINVPISVKGSFVSVKGKSYPLNQPVATPYGTISFLSNPAYIPGTNTGDLSFSLYKTRQIAAAISGGLDITAVGKLSSIVKLKMKDEIPERGEDILNKLLENYNRSAVDFKNDLAKNTLAFLDERLKTVASDLKKVEQQVQAYKTGNGIVNLGDQGRLYLQNVSENNQKLSLLNTKMAVLNQVEKYVVSKESTAGIVPATAGVDDPMLGTMLNKLYLTETEYNRVKTTAGENNPLAKTLESQIENLRPGILENVRNQKKSVSAGLGSISSTNSQYNGALSTIPMKERGLIDVSREQAVKNNTYAFLLQKREQTALAYSLPVADNKIIDPAQASSAPAGPGKKVILLAALVLALGLTVMFVLYKELLTDKILFRDEIEKYSTVPFAGEIGKLRKKTYLPVGRDADKIQTQLRQVRVAMGLGQYKTDNNKILITSGNKKEGKTLISIQLAISLSLSGKSVVLIDGDMRNPKTTAVFSLQGKPGLKDILEKNITTENAVHQSSYSGLSVMPAGTDSNHATELLLNGKLEGVIKALEEKFDYIIMDFPAINEEIDAYIISQFSDITLYLIRHNSTAKQTVKNFDENLTIKPLRNPAIIFNAIKPRGFFIYSKNRGYGYEL